MAKTSYASLKLKVQTNPKKIDFNGNEIEVLQYLPIEDKYDLIMITLQKSIENNSIYNPIKKDMYFHLYMIYMYTDINFTEKQKENESKLYDTLQSNGLISKIIENIPEEEYNLLFEYMDEIIEETMYYKTSIPSLLNNVIMTLPQKAKDAVEALNNFDPEKYTELINFAKSINGDREIQ